MVLYGTQNPEIPIFKIFIVHANQKKICDENIPILWASSFACTVRRKLQCNPVNNMGMCLKC